MTTVRSHARLAAEWLREAGVDERVVNGVLAHAYAEYQTDRMSQGDRPRRRGGGATGRRRRWSGPNASAGMKGLERAEEAEGAVIRSRGEPRRGHRRGGEHRPAAGRVPRRSAIEGLQEVAPEIEL